MNRTVKQIKQDIAALDTKRAQLDAELARVRTLTLNEQDYGCTPEEMGTSGLINFVRGPHWPYVPESTCFVARMQLAEEILTARGHGAQVLTVFRKAVYAGRA